MRIEAQNRSREGQVYRGFMRTFLFVLILVTITSVGCNRLLKVQEPAKTADTAKERVVEVKDIRDLIVAESFNWNTAQEVNMRLRVLSKDGKVQSGKVVKLYYRDSVSNQSRLMMTGRTDKDGVFTSLYSLPTYVREIELKMAETGERVYEVPINSRSFEYTLRI